MAYTNVWNDALPSGFEAANTIDDIFRGLKVDIEQRLMDIFGTMPAFTTDPLRPYGLKFTDAQDAVINLGDNAGTPRLLKIKDKAGANTYLSISSIGAIITGTLDVSGSINSTTGANTAVLAANTATTGYKYIQIVNTSGALLIGTENSVGNVLVVNAEAYSAVFGNTQPKSVHLFTNNTVRVTISSTGVATFTSTITGTRHIGGTDIATAIAAGVFSDGSALGSNDIAIGNILGIVSNFATASAAGTKAVADFVGKQTVATTGALTGVRGYIWSANTTGSIVLGIGIHASGQFDGNGGTSTAIDLIRSGNFVVGAGHTVTTLRGVHITSGANTGTITTHVGLEIDNLALAGTNIAVRSAGGVWIYGSIPTASAGLAAGTIWSNAGVLNIV